MKKNINGSVSFSLNESAYLCLLLIRLYVGNYDLSVSERYFIKSFLSVYLNHKIC